MLRRADEQEERAQRLHKYCLIVDATELIHVATNERWFERARQGGVDIVWITVGGNAGIAETIRAAAKS